MKEQVFETLWISKYLRERDKSRKYVYIYTWENYMENCYAAEVWENNYKVKCSSRDIEKLV